MADENVESIATAEEHVQQAVEETEKAAERTPDAELKESFRQVGDVLTAVQRQLARLNDHLDKQAEREVAEANQESAAVEQEVHEEAPEVVSPPAPERKVRRMNRKVKR